jgi:hypothetical protein
VIPKGHHIFTTENLVHVRDGDRVILPYASCLMECADANKHQRRRLHMTPSSSWQREGKKEGLREVTTKTETEIDRLARPRGCFPPKKWSRGSLQRGNLTGQRRPGRGQSARDFYGEGGMGGMEMEMVSDKGKLVEIREDEETALGEDSAACWSGCRSGDTRPASLLPALDDAFRGRQTTRQ